MKKLIGLIAMSLICGCAARSQPLVQSTPKVYRGAMCFLEDGKETEGHNIARGTFVYDEKNNQITFTSLTMEMHQHDQCLVLH